MRRVLVHVQRQIGMLEAQEEIKTQVQEELGERQREMYLREQRRCGSLATADTSGRPGGDAHHCRAGACPIGVEQREPASGEEH